MTKPAIQKAQEAYKQSQTSITQQQEALAALQKSFNEKYGDQQKQHALYEAGNLKFLQDMNKIQTQGFAIHLQETEAMLAQHTWLKEYTILAKAPLQHQELTKEEQQQKQFHAAQSVLGPVFDKIAAAIQGNPVTAAALDEFSKCIQGKPNLRHTNCAPDSLNTSVAVVSPLEPNAVRRG